MAPSANRDRPSIQLPSWLFDIDDEDEEINTQVSIFQELEIDLAQILRYNKNCSYQPLQ